jgi:hypothetical protein
MRLLSNSLLSASRHFRNENKKSLRHYAGFHYSLLVNSKRLPVVRLPGRGDARTRASQGGRLRMMVAPQAEVTRPGLQLNDLLLENV